MRTLIRQSVTVMDGYVPGEQPAIKNLIKLNTNENPYPPSPLIEKRLREIPGESLRLYPDPVFRRLQTKIAEIHGTSGNHVIAGNGSDELLALCTRAFVENNGSIGFFYPSYSLYPVLSDIREVEQRPVTLTSDFRWQMPEDYSASLFFLTNPNAPTGMLFDKKTIRRFCRSFDGVVVIDEAYVDFAREDCMLLARSEPNVLVMRTFSKSFSLAGLRAGYIVGHPELIEALFKVKDSYNMDSITQELALAALNDLEWMKINCRKIITTRERLSAALTDMGFYVAPSESNFVWARPPQGFPARKIFSALRREAILVRYFEGDMIDSFIRITVGTDTQIDRLLEVLRKELHV